jgi:hypothetical protein
MMGVTLEFSETDRRVILNEVWIAWATGPDRLERVNGRGAFPYHALYDLAKRLRERTALEAAMVLSGRGRSRDIKSQPEVRPGVAGAPVLLVIAEPDAMGVRIDVPEWGLDGHADSLPEAEAAARNLIGESVGIAIVVDDAKLLAADEADGDGE